MPRPRDPNRDKAFEIYREYAGDIDLVEIASQLSISPGTVRGWKSKDDWDAKLNGTLQKNTERSKRMKGGQPGNKNAVGHGGTGPPGNKNAVTTGEFETLLFDCLEPEEQQLAAAVQLDKEQLLLQEIQLLTVRERRMLKRIDNLKHAADAQTASRYDLEVPPGMTAVSYKSGVEKGKLTDMVEHKGTLGQIQSIEDALTRVQAQKQRAIETLHRFGYDDARLELEMMKVEMAALKLGGQETEQEDDGFLSALNAEAGSLWEGDEDDD